MLYLALLALGLAAPPDADWRTIRTEHYRLHFPAEAEAWSTAAASRLEAMHARVEDQVGHELDKVIDVVVRDPFRRRQRHGHPNAQGPAAWSCG